MCLTSTASSRTLAATLARPDALILFSTLLSDGEIARGRPLTWWYVPLRATATSASSPRREPSRELEQTRPSARQRFGQHALCVPQRVPGLGTAPVSGLTGRDSQPLVHHRRIDEIDRAAAPRKALRRAQPGSTAPKCITRLGLTARSGSPSRPRVCPSEEVQASGVVGSWVATH